MNNWARSLALISCLLFFHPKSVAADLCTFLNHGLTLAASIHYHSSNNDILHLPPRLSEQIFHSLKPLPTYLHRFKNAASILCCCSNNNIFHLRSPLSGEISHSLTSLPTCLHHSYLYATIVSTPPPHDAFPAALLNAFSFSFSFFFSFSSRYFC
jgi:hypothetical protein